MYCIYLKCFTDGPTGVWCVCACACNNAEEANIMGRRLLGHLSLNVCERTGHSPSFTFVKSINSFYFIRVIWRCFSFFFFLFLSRQINDKEPCCFTTKAGGLSICTEYEDY